MKDVFKVRVFFVYTVIVVSFLFNIYVLDGGYAEDAYIFFRYAENLHLGHGLNFNSYERVEGYTSLLWTILLYTGYWFDTTPEQLAKLLGIIFSLSTLIFTAKISIKVLDTNKYLWALPSIALAFNYSFLYTTTSGLDQPLFNLLLLSAFYAQHFKKSFLISNILWSLAVLTRPEGIALWGLSTFLKEAFEFGKTKNSKCLIKQIIKQSFPILVFIIHTIVRYNYYGFVLANTAYLKIGNPPGFLIESGIKYMIMWLKSGISPIILTLALIFLKFFKREIIFDENNKKFFALILFWTLYIVYVGGDWIPGFRFMTTLLPFIFLMIAKNLEKLLESKYIIFLYFIFAVITILDSHLIHSSSIQKGFLILSGTVATITALYYFNSKLKITNLYFILFALPLTFGTATNGNIAINISEQNNIVRYLVSIGHWAKNNIPKDFKIAINPAGAVPYFSKLSTLDMLGLNDTYIAHKKNDTGFISPGHDKVAPRYIIDRSPDIIFPGLFWLTDSSNPKTNRIQDNLKRYAIDRALLSLSSFHEKYCLAIISNHNIRFQSDRPLIKGSPEIKEFFHFYLKKEKEDKLAKALKQNKVSLISCTDLSNYD